MPRPKNRSSTWVKNHPLEGDGLVTGFYNFLYKRNTKTMKACKDVFVPDTIVFDHNFPRGWYTSDLKAKEISKKQGKELDAASIYNAFSKTPNPSVAIVASYMCSYDEEDANGETNTVTQVEFFNEETVKEFVGRKVKREGILQKFLIPKGHRNSVIQAVWSPRVCIVQRRTNVCSIKDKLQCERDPYTSAVTYEGPSHFSEEGTCAGHTTEEVKNICGNIVQHFYNLEHKYITRMVLYFKVDEKDQVWLLWCGSLRVSDRDQPSQMPLNLAPRFVSPALENTQPIGSPSKEDKMLHEADLKHVEMTNDTLFYASYVKPQSPRDADRKAPGDHHDDKQRPGDTSPRTEKENEQSAAAVKAHEDDWHNVPGISDQYRELMLDREMVLSTMEDIFYEAYGHFLRHNPGPFHFEVDRGVAQTMGVDVLQDLMQAVKIEHAIVSDETGTAVDDEEVSFVIPPNHPSGPVTKLGEAVKQWIVVHYAKREQELKDEAAAVPHPPPNEDEKAPADTAAPQAAVPPAAT